MYYANDLFFSDGFLPIGNHGINIAACDVIDTSAGTKYLGSGWRKPLPAYCISGSHFA
jgi:hypothetical protein